MNYGPSDSSGTDDDLPPSHRNRLARGAYIPESNRATGLSNLPYNRVQNDVDHEIHCLEQEAYCSVLRAFKVQSDVITWEKEDLMTDLRKELRVSDEEHRELLVRVNADDMIKRIREWRQARGVHHSIYVDAQPGQEPEPCSTLSVSRKKMRTFHSVGSFSVGGPSSAGHPRAAASKHLLSSAQKGGTGEPTEAGTMDPLIGRKVMTRWPEDNNFYEPMMADYNAKEMSPKDIIWEGGDPGISDRANGGPRCGIKRSMSRVGATGAGRGRGALKCRSVQHFSPLQNGVGKDDPDIIDMLHTDSLIKEVDRILRRNHPDPVEIEKAKKMLKDHEKTLLYAISSIARLEDASDGERDDSSYEKCETIHFHKARNEPEETNHQSVRNSNCSRGVDDILRGLGQKDGSKREHLVVEKPDGYGD